MAQATSTSTPLETPVEGLESTVEGVVTALYGSLRTLKRAGSETGVDGAASFVLHYLLAKGAVRPSELAAEMCLDGSTVSRHLQALERLDLVSRERDPADGRAFRVTCTEAGRAAHAASIAARTAMLTSAVESWDPTDLSQLEQLLRRLADDLAKAPTTRTTTPVATTPVSDRETGDPR
ncbi:DNA-binding MarR family transcriptional regulator [Motilibacter rhizosphaerae]|uniref:DNA-binding MarR family transcriptional regulator n=1 Tax=Motilibacter rhizosphaerae TaxID=598652 RepID=A0A4V2F4E4_9ACTN|nr:MarR family winged helix-turn-helix transcriptional regulator [Motilibacter rhizosphaerae]RZS87317.1 DNA-binding MarR family transcriptional regulator [Motilibacter rhizosphaerae]